MKPPPERYPPDDPREWLNRAKSNLRRARERIPGVYLEDMCYDAQQAAEKAVKALMIRRELDFPFVHDLDRLISLLEEDGEVIPDEVRQVGQLTKYAIVGRYPHEHRPVSEDDFKEALALAEVVVRWAEGVLS